MIREHFLDCHSLAKTRLPVIPRLLVSVRNAAEAHCVLGSGADIVDVKEPANGALGMANTATISEIAQLVTERNRQGGQPAMVEFSVALGEVADWLPSEISKKLPDTAGLILPSTGSMTAGSRSNAPLPMPLPMPEPSMPVSDISGIASNPVRPFLKLGPGRLNTAGSLLAGFAVDGQNGSSHALTCAEGGAGNCSGEPSWLAAIQYARQQVTSRIGASLNVGPCRTDQPSSLSAGSVTSAALWPRCWIAVSYADALRCGAPDVLSMAKHATQDAGCAGLLIDTGIKDGSGLFNWVTPEQLSVVRQMTASKGLLLALAGQIRIEDLPALVPLRPDVIGVRGAVCGTGNRQNAIESCRIERFREAIHSAFSGD